MGKSAMLLLFAVIFSSGCLTNGDAFLKALDSADVSGRYSVIHQRLYSSPGGTEILEMNYSVENGLVSCNNCTVEYSSSYSDIKMSCSEANMSDCAGALLPEDIRNMLRPMTSACAFNYTDRKCFFGNLRSTDAAQYEALVCFGPNGEIVNYQEQGIRPSIKWVSNGYDQIEWQDVPEWFYKKCP